jgi:L-ascorbate metabolism protein UlaG (beta-lactamase superfamily)
MWPDAVMPARIVYIHHDCFFVLTGERALLFDYPSPQYLPEAARAAAAAVMAGATLTVFISHSHEDHCDPDMLTATRGAASRRFVVSDDVADRYADRLPPDTLTMEPEEARDVDGLAVTTLESNDMGVAYRIEADRLSVYFGGDLALWDWPGQSQAARRAVGMSWRRALARIRRTPIDIAFSNMDPRLPESLAGAPGFVAKVAPRVFVPMHLGGHVEYLDRHAARLVGPKTTLFRYATPGDVMEVAL